MAKKFALWGSLSFIVLFSAVFFLNRSLLSYGEFRSLRITDRYGKHLRTILSGRGGTSIWVPLEKISPNLIHAQIAAEDKRFFHHPGIDPLAVGRAFKQNWKKGRVVSGASTITQQLVRVVRGYPRSLPFKAWEGIQALLLESGTSKKKILEHYLNRVPYGNQCYGIGAAAKLYFDKPASELSLAEAAFIAGLAQSPSKFNPYRSFERAQIRQRYVLDRLYSNGYLNEDERHKAFQEPLALVPNKGFFRAPHFCDMVVASLPSDLALVPQEIRTTLDLEIQEDLEGLAASHVKQMSREQLSNAALVVMNNHTHEILAMVGSADYLNEENGGQVNGALAPRPPGSTWKPFTYAIAIERGRTVADVIPDVPVYALSTGGNFTPRNYDEHFHGPTRLRTALACSYNIPVVRVLEEMGTDILLQRLHSLGFTFLTKPAGHYGLGLTLGGAEASLLQLVRSYSTLANEGLWSPEKYLLDANLFPSKNIRQSERIFSPSVAYLVTDILADRDARRPAFGGYSSLSLPFSCAIKTGTSKNFRDGWTIGYTPTYTVGAWVGNFNGSPMKSISGASGASMLFKQAMIRAHRGTWPENFSMPQNIQMGTVCPNSGLRPSASCPSSLREKFIVGTEPTAICQVHHLIAIDTRTDLLASADCDPTFVRQKNFEVYDSVYSKWVIENQIPLPPTRVSPLCSQDGKGEPVALLNDGLPNPNLEITFPDSGDVFVVDPILRSEFQTIRLAASFPQGVREVEWLINGNPFKPLGTGGETRWPLQRGRHEFKLRAKIGSIWKESPLVWINVI